MVTHPDGPAVMLSLRDAAALSLSEEARALLPDAPSLAEFGNRLIEAGLEVDAVRFIAHALPARRAVWWATLCAWHAAAGTPSVTHDHALGAAACWVVHPSAENRGRAEVEAGRADLDNPAGCCAMAAFLAGTAPRPDAPLTGARPTLVGRAVTSAVFLAQAQRTRAEPTANYSALLNVGMQIFNGKVTWSANPQ